MTEDRGARGRKGCGDTGGAAGWRPVEHGAVRRRLEPRAFTDQKLSERERCSMLDGCTGPVGMTRCGAAEVTGVERRSGAPIRAGGVWEGVLRGRCRVASNGRRRAYAVLYDLREKFRGRCRCLPP